MSARAMIVGALLGLPLVTGCGASSYVAAPHADYPISMSGYVRDENGKVAQGGKVVGSFDESYKACSMLWRIVKFTGTHDVSDEINQKVKAAGGDAVVNFKVGSGATIWNIFTVIGILPDCSSVKLHGDIVRVQAAATAPAGAPPAAPAAP